MGNCNLLHLIHHNSKDPISRPKCDLTVCSDPESISSPQSASPSPVLSEECHDFNHVNPRRVSIKSFIRQSMAMENGVTGKYISRRLVSVAAGFWFTHIDSLSADAKLEIGATMFFGMIASNKEVRDITKSNLSTNIKLKQRSVKFLDMMSYLIRSLLSDDIDFESMLQRLGAQHKNIGVELHHFDVMIQSLHETMSYYFPKRYDIDVQYAMDQIITISAKIMTNTMTRNNSLRRLCTFHGVNTRFLQSLELCLASDIGTEYFLRYLENQCCHEVSVYLKLMQKFRNQRSDQERFMVAKEIIKCCIVADGEFAINISYETRKNILDKLQKLEEEWLSVPIPIDYFEKVEMEMRRLIIQNHWLQFVESIGNLRNSVTFDANNMDHMASILNK